MSLCSFVYLTSHACFRKWCPLACPLWPVPWRLWLCALVLMWVLLLVYWNDFRVLRHYTSRWELLYFPNRTMNHFILQLYYSVSLVVETQLWLFVSTILFPFQSHSPRNINNTPRSDQLECLDHHLKKLVVISYGGTESEVNFIKFFILNAKVLEFMKIVTHGSDG